MTKVEKESDKNRHDNFIKKVFEYPEATKAFFEQHLPDQLKRLIKLDSITATKETFIEEHLRNKACDILFETN